MRKFLMKGGLALATALVALAAPQARAQDIDTFKPSGSGYDSWGTLQLVHPEIGLAGGAYAGLGLVYADDPLVRVDGATGAETAVVSSQFSTRVAAGYNLLGVARLDVAMPLYPSVVMGGQAGQFALGDLRIGANVPLLHYDRSETGRSGVGISVAPYLALPTGDPALFTSAGAISGGAVASVGGRVADVGWTANAGIDLEQASVIGAAQDQGSSVDAGFGLNYWLNPEYLIGAEIDGELTIAGDTADYRESPVEAHLYGTWGDSSGLFATVGGGMGLIAGIGAPDYRVFLLLGLRGSGAPADMDRDGLVDSKDACPSDPEDVDGFEDGDGCPDVDNDRDGVLDVDDVCPDEPEDRDEWEDRDGCPDPDNDGDGVLDVDDACPIRAGLPELQGCPDRDEDGLADRDDACPDEPGPASAQGCPDRDGDRVPDKRDDCPDEPADPRIDPERSNGCPSLAFVSHDKIVILEKVYFDTDKDTIKPVSFPVLDEVVKVLEEYPDITKIKVAGHTDSQGPDDYNLDLSDRRAAAVVKYLTDKGIDPSRLTSQGYGESAPIETNDTAEGRARNRRVEFEIIEQDAATGERVRTQ